MAMFYFKQSKSQRVTSHNKHPKLTAAIISQCSPAFQCIMFSVGGQHRSTTKTLTNWEKKTLQIHLLHPGLRQLVHATPLFLNLIISHFFPSFRPLVLEQPQSVLPLGLFLKQHLIKVPHPCTQITQQYQLGVTLGTRQRR